LIQFFKRDIQIMARRKSEDISPGKGGIGHKIKKSKKIKSTLNSVKTFGMRKITEFLSENSNMVKSIEGGEGCTPRRSKRNILGEVSNNRNDRINVSESKLTVNVINEAESESELVQEINEIYEKYKKQSVTSLANVESEEITMINNVIETKKVIDNSEDAEMEGLCEYEKIRLRNIREREEMFAKLKIQEAISECSTKPKGPQKRIFKPKEVLPPRKSLRIAGGVPEIDRFSASFEDNQLDEGLVSRPRRSLPANCNDYLHATRTFTGNERPDGLVPVEEGRFKILQVPKKCTIKQFVLSNSLEFKCGRGFYEFTKPEIISHKKEVVLIEKSSGKMFTGSDACRMIGAGTGIRIPPTTFETWRVFV